MGRVRERRRITEAALVASVLSGAPSTLHALATTRSLTATARYALDATRAIGALVPPFRPGLVRGAIAHVAISVAMAEVLAHALPRRRSLLAGAGGGLAMGLVNVGVVGRRVPPIRALPLGPQLADNAAFGLVFAAVADR